MSSGMQGGGTVVVHANAGGGTTTRVMRTSGFCCGVCNTNVNRINYSFYVTSGSSRLFLYCYYSKEASGRKKLMYVRPGGTALAALPMTSSMSPSAEAEEGNDYICLDCLAKDKSSWMLKEARNACKNNSMLVPVAFAQQVAGVNRVVRGGSARTSSGVPAGPLQQGLNGGGYDAVQLWEEEQKRQSGGMFSCFGRCMRS